MRTTITQIKKATSHEVADDEKEFLERSNVDRRKVFGVSYEEASLALANIDANSANALDVGG